MEVAIIKYNAGNIRSVDYALKRLGINAVITDEHEVIASADRVIFPGVGEASTTMSHLRQTGLDDLIRELRQPVLGICLGLQLMCRHSEEGDTECLGIFPIEVRKFVSETPLVKVPHMGWNALENMSSPLFRGLDEGAFVYFVHSYFAELSDYTIAETGYIDRFSAALCRDNFYATQFHPEKSADTGSRILENFIRIGTTGPV
jgi:glutamine amidotransferase